MFAEVIVDVAHSETDRVFDYAFSFENVKVGSKCLSGGRTRKVS